MEDHDVCILPKLRNGDRGRRQLLSSMRGKYERLCGGSGSKLRYVRCGQDGGDRGRRRRRGRCAEQPCPEPGASAQTHAPQADGRAASHERPRPRFRRSRRPRWSGRRKTVRLPAPFPTQNPAPSARADGITPSLERQRKQTGPHHCRCGPASFAVKAAQSSRSQASARPHHASPVSS